MAAYPDVLRAMIAVLESVGETKWRAWLEEDLRAWEATRLVEHHLEAYGGPGSLNDLFLLARNGFPLSPRQEPWVDSLFQDLSTASYVLAKAGGKAPAQDVEHRLGTEPLDLKGWRCLACGHAEVTHAEAEQWLARTRLRAALVESLRAGGAEALARAVLAGEASARADDERARLPERLARSHIHLVDRQGWMRPCPACGGKQTAVYEWAARPDGAFVPRGDNLPVRD